MERETVWDGPGPMADSLAVGGHLGSYRIESVIGGAPLSVVYRAAHVRLGTAAAIKVLEPGWGGDDEARSRCLRDVRLAAAVDHPNIVPIIDVGEHQQSSYVVMRHVAGGDLKALLARAGALDPGVARAILAPVGRALDAAHAASSRTER
jgi:serine/threonine protein kinase